MSKYLSVTVTDLPADYTVRLVFVTPRGKRYTSEVLELTDSVCSFGLVSGLLDGIGELLAEIVIYYEDEFIEKSRIYKYAVLQSIAFDATAALNMDGLYFLGDYNLLSNKPRINGVALQGNKTSEDLGIGSGGWAAETITGTSLTLADKTEYRGEDISELTLTYPEGNFDCWLKLTFATSNEVGVIFPDTTSYIGNVPWFDWGETWEVSIKDGVVIAAIVDVPEDDSGGGSLD